MTSAWRAIFQVSSVGLTIYGLLFNVAALCFWSWDIGRHLRVADQLLESYQRQVAPMVEQWGELRPILEGFLSQAPWCR